MDTKPLPMISSETKFSVMRRSLHILSLIQHSGAEQWNAKTLADALSLVPGDEDVSEKMIAGCIEQLKEAGFPVVTEKGARSVYLERELSGDEMLEVLSFYIGSSAEETIIRDSFGSYVASSGAKSLWMIARVYFAALEKRKVKLVYRSESKRSGSDYTVHPLRWVFRDNALYLAAYRPGTGISLFRLTRLLDITVLDEHFEVDDDAHGILSKSLGAFIGERIYRIRLSFDAALRNRIIEEFGRLELIFDETGERMTVSFEACDLLSVCKAVFPFAGAVVIEEPKEAIAEMKRLVEGNAGVIKG